MSAVFGHDGSWMKQRLWFVVSVAFCGGRPIRSTWNHDAVGGPLDKRRDENQPDAQIASSMNACSSRKSPPAAQWLRLGAWLLTALMLTGCRVVQGTLRMPGQVVQAVTPGSQSRTVDLAVLQRDLQRFADEYAERTTSALDSYARNVGTAEARRQALRWKVTVNSAVITIVTGPNPQVNLLDCLALATLTRMALEEITERTDHGPAFGPWLAVSHTLEAYAWDHLAARAFSGEQIQELRDVIQRWWELNPAGHLTFFARPLEARSLIYETGQPTSRPGSVFALVGLDPTAGLDPAVRELTSTRLLAERFMFMAQRMPSLLRWHLELLADDLLQEENIAQWLTKTAQLIDSAERISRAVEAVSVTVTELPDRITAERQAILEAIKVQEETLGELAVVVSQTLAAGEGMSTSVNTTLTTFDALMERFGVGIPPAANPPAASSEESFRILDYAHTATQLEAAARQLTVLLETLDQTLDSTNLAELSTQVGMAVEQAQTGGREVVDYAFWRAILLVLAVLVAALIYRWTAARLTYATRSRIP
jgi:hypothetical protein